MNFTRIRPGAVVLWALFAACDQPAVSSDMTVRADGGSGLPGDPCDLHRQCMSDVCAAPTLVFPGQTQKKCLDPRDVIYVHTPEDLPAIAAGKGIRVYGGAYDSWIQQAGSAAFYGPDGDSPSAHFKSIQITRAGPDPSFLILDQIQTQGLSCQGAIAAMPQKATVYLVGSTVADSQSTGMVAARCEVHIRDSVFTGNHDGALWLKESDDYFIIDSQFRDNPGMNAAAVRIAETSQPLPGLAFDGNDIVRNTTTFPAQVAGGLDCGDSSMVNVRSVLLCGNSPGAAGNGFTGQCNLLGARVCP